MIRILFLFLFLSTINADGAEAVCPNGILESGETCDLGTTYTGYYYNNTCCSSTCTLLGNSSIYNMVVCNSNADCNDNNANTVDTCDTTLHRCRHAVTGSTYTCTGTGNCPQTDSPCYSRTSCTSGFCKYTSITLSTFLTPFKNSHCLNEGSCAYNFACSNGYENFTAPSIISTTPASASLNCYTNYSFATLFGITSSTTSTRFPAPAVTITSVTKTNNQCPYTLYMYQTGPLAGTIMWGAPYDPSKSGNPCSLTVTTTAPECTGGFDISKTFTFSFTLPSRSPIDNNPCALVSLVFECNDLDSSTTDVCLSSLGFCRNEPPNLGGSCSSDASCKYYPCYTQKCVNSGLNCQYDRITSSSVPAPLTGTACTATSACKANFRCDQGVVVYDELAPYPSTSQQYPISIRCNSSIYARDIFPSFNFSAFSSGYRFMGLVIAGPYIPIFTNNDTYDMMISFSGPPTQHYDSTEAVIVNSRIRIFIRPDCPNTVFTYAHSYNIAISFNCCNDGILDAGEECDLGRQLNYTSWFGGVQSNTIYNDSPSTCCTSSCTLDTSHRLCRNSNQVCREPSYCDTNYIVPIATGNCPNLQQRNSSYVCSVSTSPCTFNSTCSLTYNNCSYNVYAPGTSCNADGNLCTLETCDVNGTCNFQSAVNYDDGQYCNGVESCDPLTGLMVPGTPINCTSPNSCFTGSCSELTQGCVYTPIANSTGACGISNLGACRYGNYSCNGAGPTPVITCVGAINPSAEICLPGGVDENCNGVVDENCNTTLCTTNANCSSVVVGNCQIAVCDTFNHVCVIQNATNGTPCNDGLACTTSDQCVNNFCTGTPIVCNDNNPCTQDTCTEPSGSCSYSGASMLGAPCNADNSLCTQNDSCDNQGNCISGTTITCNSTGNQCTVGVCNATTGMCDIVNVVGPCDDGTACTTGDQCIGSLCVGSQIDCNDHLTCTTDTCISPGGVCSNVLNPGSCYISSTCYLDGAVNPSNPCQVCNSSLSTSTWSFTSQTGVSCNDGNLCTNGDVCNINTQTCAGTPLDCSSYSDQCNIGVCQIGTGTCTQQPRTDGTSCSDGLFCTLNDFCASGVCSSGTIHTCSDYNSACTVGYCNETAGACQANPVLDFTSCTLDNLVCNGAEHCLAGECVYGTPLTCPADTQCSYYLCQEPSGCTQYFNSGASCDDSNVCTIGDTCAIGSDVCNPGSGTLNCDDNNDCTDDFCDHIIGCYHTQIVGCANCTTVDDCTPQSCHTVSCPSGQCLYTHVANGTSCSDGNICNGVETCLLGTCLNPPNLVCNDNNPCTVDTCDSITGCVYTPNTTLPYDDNNPCTINDRCSANGTAVSEPYVCPSSTTCKSYSCINSGGLPVCQATAINIGGSCDDSDPCTHFDVCDTIGNCGGTPISCPSPNQCEISVSCVGGNCIHTYKSNGTLCQTGNLCTSDYCNGAGTCVQGPQVVTCVALDQCHDIGVCNPSTGICSNPASADNTPCNDGNACTQTDICMTAVCTGTNPVHCTALDQCHIAGICNTTTGTCTNPLASDFTNCDDNNACTSSSVCLSGICTGISATDCSSPNICITTGCNNITGCTSSFNFNPCDDNNACTLNTVCSSGSCNSGSGTPLNCDDGLPCTADSCSPSSGCIHTSISGCQPCTTAADCNLVPCNTAICLANNTCSYVVNDTNTAGCLDSQFCNGIEYCSSGTCQAGTPPNCADSNPCTLDSCDYGLGICVNTPNVNQSCTSSNLCALAARCDETATCVPTTLVQCSPAPSCQMLSGCNPSTGSCEYVFHIDGTPCNDNNACTQTDTCMLGDCVGDNYVVCTPLDQCHLAGTCNPSTGACTNPNAIDGTACNDGLFCTAISQCITGTCTSISTPACPIPVGSYDVQCQHVVCNEATDDCSIVNYADGTTCSYSAPSGVCSGTDTCQSGVCTRNYAAGQLCRSAVPNGCDIAEYCIYGQDTCPPDAKVVDGTSCPTNLYCFSAQCSSGLCLENIPRDCSFMDNQCEIGVCDETLNTCKHAHRADGTICYTNITGECILFDTCQSGACEHVFASSSTPCDTSSLCIVNSHCSGSSSACITGTPKDCSSFNSQCTTGRCNTTSGDCYMAISTDNTTCDADANPCTVGDKCTAGVCNPGSEMDCSYLDSYCGPGVCHIVNGTYGVCQQLINSSLCLTYTCTGGCTHGNEYWESHSSFGDGHAWPSNAEHNMLCAMTWKHWYQQHARHLAWRLLAQQYIAAHLNRLKGACVPSVVDNALLDASVLLNQCDMITAFDAVGADIYRNYTFILKYYNNGTYGPGHCTDGDNDFAQHRGLSQLEILFIVLAIILGILLCCLFFIITNYYSRRQKRNRKSSSAIRRRNSSSNLPSIVKDE